MNHRHHAPVGLERADSSRLSNQLRGPSFGPITTRSWLCLKRANTHTRRGPAATHSGPVTTPARATIEFARADRKTKWFVCLSPVLELGPVRVVGCCARPTRPPFACSHATSPALRPIHSTRFGADKRTMQRKVSISTPPIVCRLRRAPISGPDGRHVGACDSRDGPK